MRNYRRYPEYKDSGIEWLGEIPVHWEIRRLKNVVTLWNEKVLTIDLGKPYIGMENVESWTGKILDTDLEVTGTANTFEAGDVLFGKLRPYLAKAIFTHMAGQCSSEFLVMKPNAVSGRFLHLLVLSDGFVRTVDSATYGTKMPRANWETVSGIGTAIPKISEQRAIVDFLDRETAKIDALVERKERLIKLLKEKRTALITHAVTKGLDPNVPMKDSGIEWLGKIPAHWEVTAIKRFGDVQGGSGFPDIEQGFVNEEIPFFKVSDMNLEANAIKMVESTNTVSRNAARRLRAFVFPPDTIIFPKVGAALMTNKRRILTKPSCVDNNVMGFVPRCGNPKWFYWWLSGLDLGEIANPGALPSVNEGQVRELPVVWPPLQEQAAIADFLDRETSKIDALIGKIEEAIKLLKEYRTALISATVTGKIDVRNE